MKCGSRCRLHHNQNGSNLTTLLSVNVRAARAPRDGGVSRRARQQRRPVRPMRTARILLVDDHPIVRDGVRALLKPDSYWQVCAEATTGQEAIEKATQLQPQVVLLDISLPDLDGFQVTREILKVVPQTKVLILTMHDSPQMLREAMSAGARGYLTKCATHHELRTALQAVLKNEYFLPSELTEAFVAGDFRPLALSRAKNVNRKLSPRQLEVIRLLAGGKSNKEVAGNLGISVKTVESHRAKIMQELELHSFSDLIRYAVRENIVSA